jgi:hypothetical protein
MTFAYLRQRSVSVCVEQFDRIRPFRAGVRDVRVNGLQPPLISTNAALRREAFAIRNNGRHHVFVAKGSAVRGARQIEMKSAILVRWKTLLLLRQIVGIVPGGHRRIGAGLGRLQRVESRISAEVGRVRAFVILKSMTVKSMTILSPTLKRSVVVDL